jgi:hypothetical protein
MGVGFNQFSPRRDRIEAETLANLLKSESRRGTPQPCQHFCALLRAAVKQPDGVAEHCVQ